MQFVNLLMVNFNQKSVVSFTGFCSMSSLEIRLSDDVINSEEALIPFRTLTNDSFVNGYPPEEIVSFLKYKIKNGGL